MFVVVVEDRKEVYAVVVVDIAVGLKVVFHIIFAVYIPARIYYEVPKCEDLTDFEGFGTA